MHPWLDLEAMEEVTCLSDEELGQEARVQIPVLVGALALERELLPVMLTAQIQALLASHDDERLGVAARSIIPALVQVLRESLTDAQVIPSAVA
jgi:hypothetical protein